MKITIFSESPNDEAALRILVEAILEEEIEEVPRPNTLKSRGYASVENELPAVINSIYYNTDAEGLVVVYDSDDTPVHQKNHPENEAERCRFCFLERRIVSIVRNIEPRPERKPLKIAFGIAVPTIEAWYLCGATLAVSEDAWKRKLAGETVRYDRTSLKQKIYGDRPFKRRQIETAINEATKLAKNLAQLEQLFPDGFGSMANEIRSWKK
jgi:hypothetical protein